MKKILFGAAALVAIGAAPALAADLPARTYTTVPVPEAVYNWTGFYVGLNAGGAWGRDAIGSTTFLNGSPVDNAAVTVATSPRLSPAGFTGGGQIGYNYQTGSLVLGVESDFEYMGLRKSTSTVFPFPSTPAKFFTVNNSMSTDWLFTARGRIGVAANNWLFYATGGLAATNERFTQTNAFLAPFVSTDSLSTTRAGWTVGAGIEYGITPNWTIKGEYLYADFGTVSTSNGVLTPPFAGSVIGNSAHLTTNIARIGVNYKSGGPVVAKY
jgi:outer membrane immunogenic protein